MPSIFGYVSRPGCVGGRAVLEAGHVRVICDALRVAIKDYEIDERWFTAKGDLHTAESFRQQAKDARDLLEGLEE